MALEPTVRHENGDFCGGGVNSRTWTSTVADGVLGGVSTTTRVSRDEHSQVLRVMVGAGRVPAGNAGVAGSSMVAATTAENNPARSCERHGCSSSVISPFMHSSHRKDAATSSSFTRWIADAAYLAFITEQQT